MIVQLSVDGVVTIIAQTDTEIFAMRQWIRLHLVYNSKDNKKAIYEIEASALRFQEGGGRIL